MRDFLSATPTGSRGTARCQCVTGFSEHTGRASATRIFIFLAAMCATGSASAQASGTRGRVELIVIGQQQASGEFHTWLQTLNQVGAARVQLRAPQPTDAYGIEVQGSAENPTYVVTAKLTSGGELIVPGGRFRMNEAGAIKRWIADLAASGPPSQRAPVGPMGLTAEDLERAKTELSVPVDVETAGKSRAEVVQTIAGRLNQSLRADPAVIRAMADDKVAEELSQFACGTALACVLRPAGLGMVPQKTPAGLAYIIGPVQPGQDVWPIGGKPEKPSRDTLPALYDSLTVNIQGVSAAKALTAISERLKTPFLLDHNALARHGVDLEKILVNVPSGRTSYNIILSKVLAQAKLNRELRTDEAGKPFLWLTTIKPL